AGATQCEAGYWENQGQSAISPYSWGRRIAGQRNGHAKDRGQKLRSDPGFQPDVPQPRKPTGHTGITFANSHSDPGFPGQISRRAEASVPCEAKLPEIAL